MAQTIFTAKEAKNNFGRLLDEARRIPVTIKKNGRKILIVVPYEQYSFLEEAIDADWGKRALKAHKKGYLGLKESNKFIQEMLNA